MKALPKSKIIIPVLRKNPNMQKQTDDEFEDFLETQFAFYFIPSNTVFKADATQEVTVWKGQSRHTFIRVRSTDKAKMPFDVLYSGRVEQGDRLYVPSNTNSLPYVEALYKLGSISKETFDVHNAEVRRRYVEELRRDERIQFDKMLCNVGLVLNKTQQAKVARHFAAMEVKA